MTRRLLKFAGIIIALWIFFAFLGPALSENIPAWKKYNEVQEEQGLDSGALYYSNVPQTQDAEETTRAAVKSGMKIRRETRQRENGE